MLFRKKCWLLLATLLSLSLGGCDSSSRENITLLEQEEVAVSEQPGEGELGYQEKLEDGTVNYIDYTGALKNAVATVSEAEYHTGTGYGNTLFDSADKKCQNCHNELYDTWKMSMHGQSWSDKIFQSKLQDFLRTHIAKIGEDKSGVTGVDGVTGIEYSETKFQGAAQTCIKCHAPAAYYGGDFKVELTTLKESNVTTEDLQTAKESNQSNLASSTQFNIKEPTSVVSVGANGKLYKATYHIGHEANREGINCAFCHSIETVRLMSSDGADMGIYTLKDHLRAGPHGPAKASAGTTLTYSSDATDGDMNKFFRLWGPEKYINYAETPKTEGFDEGKSRDGRYTMASKDINGTDGKVHFTGGPFYGPFGVTGTTNENESDETDRTAMVNPAFDMHDNNHFGNLGKGLCLSCHQRSSGASVPSGEDGAGSFMELCSTWNSVSNGSDNNYNNSITSPKCQKCHMERIEGTVLHKWARPDKLWTLADNPHLTAHFDPADPENLGDENPVTAGWYNSHAFLGASKIGHQTSVKAKIESGINATLSVTQEGDVVTVKTTLTNKTAHMFPGAHPMRRVLTRVVVADGNGTKVDLLSTTGNSTFGDITNQIATLSGKTLHKSAESEVRVDYDDSREIEFPGKVADLNGSEVVSQKFDGGTVTVTGADSTISNQEVVDGKISGTITNVAIVDSDDKTDFTRIYGHETGKRYDGTFAVRPGFDSNMVKSDNRLLPNETETYTLKYDIADRSDIEVSYRVYYMQKGANGKFITGEDGFLDQETSDANKLLVTEVFSATESLK
jgi:hypothetical protein